MLRGCLVKPTPTGYQSAGECLVMSLASGTDHDGWWETEWHVPEHSLSGKWEFRLCGQDRSHANDWLCWIGPGETAYAARQRSPTNWPDPAGLRCGSERSGH